MKTNKSVEGLSEAAVRSVMAKYMITSKSTEISNKFLGLWNAKRLEVVENLQKWD